MDRDTPQFVCAGSRPGVPEPGAPVAVARTGESDEAAISAVTVAVP